MSEPEQASYCEPLYERVGADLVAICSVVIARRGYANRPKWILMRGKAYAPDSIGRYVRAPELDDEAALAARGAGVRVRDWKHTAAAPP